MANLLRYTLRHKTSAKTNKERKLRKHSEKKKEKSVSKEGEDIGERDKNLKWETKSCEACFNPEMSMDLGTNDWIGNEEGENFNQDKIPEVINYTNDF